MVFYPICEIRGDKMGSRLKEVLKSLCCNNGWSYGVFWRIDSRNSMLLTLEDAYFEQQIGCAIHKMFEQVHMLGEGIIGQTAFSGEHRWMFSDAFYGDLNPKGSFGNQENFLGNSEFHHQFSSGIKTIAVISVLPQGVVQFGSIQKILERPDFVNHVRSLFQNLESADGLFSSIAPTSFNSEIYDPCGIVTSVVSSGNSCSNYGNKKPLHDGRSKVLTVKTESTMVHAESAPMILELQNSSMKSQFPIASAQAQVLLSPPMVQLPQALSRLTSCSSNSSASRNPSISTWSSRGSTATLSGQQMLSGMGKRESPKAHTVTSCVNSHQNFQGEATSTAPYTTSGLLNSVANTAMPQVNKHIEYGSNSLPGMQRSSPLLHATEIGELSKSYSGFHTIPGEFRQVNTTTGPPKAKTIDDLSQWIAESLEQGDSGTAASFSYNMPQRLGVASISSGLVGNGVFSGIPTNSTATSLENSLTETINSLSVVCNGKEKCLNLPMQLPPENEMFDSLGWDFQQSQGKGFWDDIVSQLGNGNCSSFNAGTSECNSEMDAGSMASIHKGLLTDIGLEQLLEGFLGNANANNKPSSEDQLSTTTITGTGSTLANGNQAQLAGHSLLGEAMDEERIHMLKNQKENVLKSRVGAWIDDSYSINTEGTAVMHPKKSDEQGKATRKRARPGESTRPRPKDRQQIQDRVKELREIVPNGAKCSIDALFDRTIKHMLFLQSVTKYADKIKQADEPKIIGDASGVVLKDNSNGPSGATWAFEVGGQTMICPIIVEDLSPPGQMLIEMLCEERGFFLEIADIIRGFGLTILKGVMEVQEAKIWARFIVEANRDVTRMDIFLSLVQLLKETASSGINSSNQPNKGADSGIPLFGSYQQSPIPLPIGLADQLH